MTEESRNNLGKLWLIFSSMKTGLALLGLIAIFSIIGTLIPQEALDADKAKAAAKIWQTLGFTHLFSSAWFRLLLGLLSLNLIVCSIQRLRGIWTLTFKPRIPLKPTSVPSKNRMHLVGETTFLRQSVENTLKERGYRLISQDNSEIWSFHGLKRRWGYWGSLITHLAFVILIVGSLLGSMLGFKGYLSAGEGDLVPIKSIQISKGQITQNFSVFINSAQDRMLANGERDNWYTDLSIMENGKEEIRQTISVNHPLTYKGVTFYQTSFENAARLTVEVKGQKVPVILHNRGNYYQAPGTDLYLIVADMSKDTQNPGILYHVYKGNERDPIQTGQLTPGQTSNIHDQYNISFDSYTGFTGLQVKQDPGVIIIWLGCFLLVAGMLLAFYWQPMVVSGVLTVNGEAGELTLGISSGKYSARVKAEFESIKEKLKESNKVKVIDSKYIRN